MFVNHTSYRKNENYIDANDKIHRIPKKEAENITIVLGKCEIQKMFSSRKFII